LAVFCGAVRVDLPAVFTGPDPFVINLRKTPSMASLDLRSIRVIYRLVFWRTARPDPRQAPRAQSSAPSDARHGPINPGKVVIIGGFRGACVNLIIC